MVAVLLRINNNTFKFTKSDFLAFPRQPLLSWLRLLIEMMRTLFRVVVESWRHEKGNSTLSLAFIGFVFSYPELSINNPYFPTLFDLVDAFNDTVPYICQHVIHCFDWVLKYSKHRDQQGWEILWVREGKILISFDLVTVECFVLGPASVR